MIAQISLTPTESKKFIAKAILQMDVVKRAVDRGTIVLHPSSSTYFLAKELLGHSPPTNAWAMGVIAPKGACVDVGASINRGGHAGGTAEAGGPGTFRHDYVIHQGSFTTGIPMDEILAKMGPEDVFVKGVNALDPQGGVAVLIGNVVEGGTIGRVLAAFRKKGFSLIFPVGLEKLIPIPVAEAARGANRKAYAYSMGMACSLLPCDGGEVITELRAVEIISGAKAVPIACGGLGGAEGAVTLLIHGDEAQVKETVRFAEECKGAQLPQLRTPSCYDCPVSFCAFPLGDKPWVVM